jgi:uncharacterized protein YecE (DUF72 family)
VAAQIPLFPNKAALELARRHARAAELIARLPSTLRLGTSSWTFPGWIGLVFSELQTQDKLARDGLAEYARHPLFRTIGLDRTFYAPVPVDDYRRYASQTPDGFDFVCKAPASMAAAVIASGPNPDFLSVERFQTELLTPMATLGHRAGPVLVELSPSGIAARELSAKLDTFFTEAPRGRYAVELRDAHCFTPRYRDTLRAHGVVHAYNHWSRMPPLDEQLRAIPPTSQPFCMARLMLPPGTRYEERRVLLEPFDAMRAPDPAMRAVVDRLLAEVEERETWIFAGNKAEGSAPETLMAVAEAAAARRGTSAQAAP